MGLELHPDPVTQQPGAALLHLIEALSPGRLLQSIQLGQHTLSQLCPGFGLGGGEVGHPVVPGAQAEHSGHGWLKLGQGFDELVGQPAGSAGRTTVRRIIVAHSNYPARGGLSARPIVASARCQSH